MANISEIQEGYENLNKKYLGIADPNIERLSEQRYNECKKEPCEFFDNNIKFCDECNCDLEAKTRAPKSRCRIGKWKK